MNIPKKSRQPRSQRKKKRGSNSTRVRYEMEGVEPRRRKPDHTKIAAELRRFGFDADRSPGTKNRP